MPDTTKSLTYAELAAALGLTAGSVRNLVRRKRWPRHTGNDGATRVVVPVEVIEEAASRPSPHDGESSLPTGGPSSAPSSLPTDGSTHLAAMAMIERHVARLESEVATLTAKAAALESERDAERAVAAQVGLQVGALQATLDAVREERDRLLTREHLRDQRRFWPFRRSA